VFAWQSGHRPLQRGTGYGIDGAYPDSLQPALLRVYYWASTEWHRFLQQNQTSDSRPNSQSAIEIEESNSSLASSPLVENIQLEETPLQPPRHPLPAKRRAATVSPPPTAAKRRRFPWNSTPAGKSAPAQAQHRGPADTGPQPRPRTELQEPALNGSSPVHADFQESDPPLAPQDSDAEWEDYKGELEESRLEHQHRGHSFRDQEILRRWKSYLD